MNYKILIDEKPNYPIDIQISAAYSDNLLNCLKEIKPDKNYKMDDLNYGRLLADVFKNVARYLNK